MHEVRDVTQYESGKHRRWFHDDEFDLYTWENYDGELLGFQLCYARQGHERALRWSPKDGYRHEGVDAPEDKPGRAMSALFVADGVFDAGPVAERFEAATQSLPPRIREWVLLKIREYPAPL
ncbi:MAG TPA: hypothetical protein VFV17_10725 [Usitatibacteraceae bacterium]|nr:hypothetical protein [Usitatibacteraceae bacterium]